MNNEINNHEEWIGDEHDIQSMLNDEVARLREKANNWHEHYRDEASKAQKCKQAYIEQEKEVARFREELQKLRLAAQAVVDRWETPLWKDAEPTASVIYRLRDALAPAPEEPTIKESLTTEPVTKRLCKDCGQPHSKHTLHPYKTQCPEPAPEWRELGPDEVISAGDQMTRIDTLMDWINVDWQFVHCGKKSKDLGMYLFRTRRPLPKQEEMPLEDRVKQAHEEFKNLAKVEPGSFITEYFIREILILRDEIQKLKQK